MTSHGTPTLATREAFRLPDGPVAIQFSGGRTSGYMLWHILDAHDGKLPDDAMVLFQNTGRERDETLDFVRDCGTEWNVPIVWLEYQPEAPGYALIDHTRASRDGAPFTALARHRRYLPNPVARFCTTELKVRPALRYLLDLGWEHWTTVLGIRADERHRARQDARTRGGRRVFPLVAAGVTRRDVGAWWQRQPFNLRLADIDGRTPGGNCDGCYLKSEVIRAALCRDEPERAAYWDALEQETGATFRPGASWRALIDFVRAQGRLPLSDDALYCTSDLGACDA